MTREKDRTVVEEVENRLNSFFGEEEESFDFKEEKAGFDDALQELKSMILSIDWEITDEGLNRFIDHLKAMEKFHEGEKDIEVFLHILGSVGKYIRTHKSHAHPEAVKLLTNVYSAMEKVMVTSDLPIPEKEKIVLQEVMRFKKLKSMITEMKGKIESDAVEKAPVDRATYVATPAPDMPLVQGTPSNEDVLEIKSRQPDRQTMAPHEAFVYALEEIKELIKIEFRALRTEIRLWRESDHKGPS